MVLGLYSGLPLELLPGTAAFRCDGVPTVPVQVIPVDKLPPVAGELCGEDGIFRYYRKGGQFYQLAIPGAEGSVSLTAYPADFSKITLYINEGAFPGVVRTADKVLQLLPMKQLLAHHGAFLLHSSRIAVNGRAILFTAPSQTGKTTQARLWRQYAGAEIAGNDRTLLRMAGGEIITSGYPVDGSSPVYSGVELSLGAIAVLRQGPEDRAERLPAAAALGRLMEQTALDAWNGEERTQAQRFWLDLLKRCPVYRLTCRPDEGAVQCLKNQLERDEVIPGAVDTP
ncbi:MAG: bacterial transcriptional activator domain-containing protein [Lachnospiraceae bacterium]|nr:bacterial transcriptional activator domain-containing protein [Lachnospiraceae bacterium]